MGGRSSISESSEGGEVDEQRVDACVVDGRVNWWTGDCDWSCGCV
jgi:hypothetical protein